MKRLPCETIEARLVMYDEAADHLEMCVADNEIERTQAKVVAKQIRKLGENFANKYSRRKNDINRADTGDR